MGRYKILGTILSPLVSCLYGVGQGLQGYEQGQSFRRRYTVRWFAERGAELKSKGFTTIHERLQVFGESIIASCWLLIWHWLRHPWLWTRSIAWSPLYGPLACRNTEVCLLVLLSLCLHYTLLLREYYEYLLLRRH